VALIGPDGAGKTTVARRLEQGSGGRVSYLYMGINPDSGNRLLPTTRVLRALRRGLRGTGSGAGTPHHAPDLRLVSEPAPPPRGLIGNARSLVGLVNRLAEEWYRVAVAVRHVRAGRTVIFDRHYLADYHATDIAASSPPLSRRLHGLALRHAYPRPDMVVYLDAPPEVLYARKGEGTLESLARKRDEYLAAGRDIPGFRVVDATQPIDSIVHEIGALVGIESDHDRGPAGTREAPAAAAVP